MATSVKEKITSDLKQVREVGKLRRDRIRDIVSAAASQIKLEVKEGSGEFRSLVKEVFAAAIAAVRDTGTEVKEEVAASVEGVLDGISRKRQESMAQTEAEIKRLQEELTRQEAALEQDLDNGLAGIEDAGKDAPGRIQEQIVVAIAAAKNSEEVTLLKRRYAQLQAQIAILKANLAARTGTYYDRAQEHLADAKQWYDQAQPKAATVKGQADQRINQLQQKLDEAGSALAKGETRVRQLLSELLHHAAETARRDEKDTQTTETPIATLPPGDRLDADRK